MTIMRHSALGLLAFRLGGKGHSEDKADSWTRHAQNHIVGKRAHGGTHPGTQVGTPVMCSVTTMTP